MRMEIAELNKALSSKIYHTGVILLAAGILLFCLAFAFNAERATFNMIIAMMFVLSIGIGSLFMVALDHLTGAVWSIPFRRVAENLSSLLLFFPVMAITVFYNLNYTFQWSHPEIVAADHILKHNAPYLNQTFFIIRTLGISAVLGIFYLQLTGRSKKQDITGNMDLTKKNIRTSAIFMPVFALFLTLLSVDYLMSLEPKWYSTIFGVYYFAGTFLAAISMITYFSIRLNENGYFPKQIGRDHYYSFGALIFAFTNFWAYIAFSQFMLIWYSNIPEETVWFLNKWHGGWQYITIGLIIVRFLVPYIALLSQPSKSNPKRLKFIALWMLFAHFYDLYWLVMPTYSKEFVFGWMELIPLILIAGITLTGFYLVSRKKSLIVTGDPNLQRGLDFHL